MRPPVWVPARARRITPGCRGSGQGLMIGRHLGANKLARETTGWTLAAGPAYTAGRRRGPGLRSGTRPPLPPGRRSRVPRPGGEPLAAPVDDERGVVAREADQRRAARVLVVHAEEVQAQAGG